MDVDTITRDRGRARLRLLLPEARKIADSGLLTEVFAGMATQAMRPYVREENFDSLIIYAANGGWYGDLLLADVPDSITNVMGTPANSPLATSEMAEKEAVRTLAAALVISDANRGTPLPEPSAEMVFRLYDIGLPLDPEVLALLGEAVTGGDPEGAKRLLADVVATAFPDGVTDARFARLSGQSKMAFCLAIHLAAREGLMAFP